LIGITAIQPHGFLICALLGALMGLCCSVLSPLLTRCKKKGILFLWDLLFCILNGLVFYGAVYLATYGVLRLFCFLAYGLGFAAAYTGPGYYIIRCEKKLMEAISKWNHNETKED